MDPRAIVASSLNALRSDHINLRTNIGALEEDKRAEMAKAQVQRGIMAFELRGQTDAACPTTTGLRGTGELYYLAKDRAETAGTQLRILETQLGQKRSNLIELDRRIDTQALSTLIRHSAQSPHESVHRKTSRQRQTAQINPHSRCTKTHRYSQRTAGQKHHLV